MSEPRAPEPTLPNAWLTEPDAFARERRTVFADAWLMLARGDALRAPGDYVCHGIAGLAAFAMRGEDGAVRAFRNVCRHQGLPVLDAGAGRSALLRCRYHGWTYRFDGAFQEAPAKYAPADSASASHGLERLALARWRHLLFVNQRADPPPLGETTAPLDVALADLPAASSGADEVVTDLQCNWKAAVEYWLARAEPGSAAAPLWHFPNLVLERRAGALVVHQIVPRTHERTRALSHVVAATPEAGAALFEAVKAGLAADKPACEALQARLAAGEATGSAAPGTALAAFRARLREAHRKAEA